MSRPAAIYTRENTRPAFQLNWSISLFWRSLSIPSEIWLDPLKEITESDGVRVLEHRQSQPDISQFLASSRPDVAPADIIRSIKGRLQHLVRDQLPRAFQRNYWLTSIGSTTADCVGQYIASQLERHVLADPRVSERFERYQIHVPGVDLGRMRSSNYGRFCCSLHLVLEYEHGLYECDDEALWHVRKMVIESSEKKGWLLSRAGIVANHLHIAVGCGTTNCPADVALSYLNNLAYLYQMQPQFRFGYYAGTIGKYDLGAIWNLQPSPP